MTFSLTYAEIQQGPDQLFKLMKISELALNAKNMTAKVGR
jgi:hypothetical protein